jgi:hypothetical protein
VEYQQIKFFGMACWWWCPGVSTAAPFRTFVCGGLLGKRSGVFVAGLCLAHCWVLRQQGLFAAMQGILVFLVVPAAGTPSRVFVWGGCG